MPCCAKGNQALSAGTEGEQSSGLRLSRCTHRVEILFWKLITCSKAGCDKSNSHSDAVCLLMFVQLQVNRSPGYRHCLLLQGWMGFPLYLSLCGKEGTGIILVSLSSTFQWLPPCFPNRVELSLPQQELIWRDRLSLCLLTLSRVVCQSI